MVKLDVKTKNISVNDGTTAQGIEVVLWSDITPTSLEITGEDIGLANAVILPGSILMTPTKRYTMGENGSFIELEW